MVKAVTCDVWRGNQWEEIDIAEALAVKGQFDMRCSECRGRVTAHKKGKNGMRAHFEHRAAHDGCRRSTGFSGAQSRHPDALG